MRLDNEKKKHQENIVLIVDDDANARQVIRKTLSSQARVIDSVDATILTNTYQQFLPNLVLIDAQTSIKNGRDAVKEILAYDVDAFIVLLSNDCTQQSILDSKNRGAKGFICKPFNRDILLRYMTMAAAASSKTKHPTMLTKANV